MKSAGNPVLNSPHQEPKFHYDADSQGKLDYEKIIKGRRVFKPDRLVDLFNIDNQ